MKGALDTESLVANLLASAATAGDRLPPDEQAFLADPMNLYIVKAIVSELLKPDNALSVPALIAERSVEDAIVASLLNSAKRGGLSQREQDFLTDPSRSAPLLKAIALTILNPTHAASAPAFINNHLVQETIAGYLLGCVKNGSFRQEDRDFLAARTNAAEPKHVVELTNAPVVKIIAIALLDPDNAACIPEFIDNPLVQQTIAEYLLNRATSGPLSKEEKDFLAQESNALVARAVAHLLLNDHDLSSADARVVVQQLRAVPAIDHAFLYESLLRRARRGSLSREAHNVLEDPANAPVVEAIAHTLLDSANADSVPELTALIAVHAVRDAIVKSLLSRPQWENHLSAQEQNFLSNPANAPVVNRIAGVLLNQAHAVSAPALIDNHTVQDAIIGSLLQSAAVGYYLSEGEQAFLSNPAHGPVTRAITIALLDPANFASVPALMEHPLISQMVNQAYANLEQDNPESQPASFHMRSEEHQAGSGSGRRP